MKKAFDQYPEVYVKSHTKYSYYTDSREKITLEVGQDGITEEWIAELKQMHREEMNMMRRGRSKGAGKNYLLSLTQFEDELADKTGAYMPCRHPSGRTCSDTIVSLRTVLADSSFYVSFSLSFWGLPAYFAEKNDR